MRVLTAIVGIPVAVGFAWVGGWPFALFVGAVATMSQREVYTLLRGRGVAAGTPTALAAGALIAMAPIHPAVAALALFTALVALAAEPVSGRVEGSLTTASGTAFGMFYPPALLSGLVALREAPGSGADPFTVTMGVVALVWAADSGAYYAGRSVGRHPLAARVSPKKTWEGFAGGIVAALGAAWAAGAWLDGGPSTVDWLALGLIAAIVGPAGDLFESALKRDAGVKDSSNVLPGHGGMLDRVDALAFVVPAAWIYLNAAGIHG